MKMLKTQIFLIFALFTGALQAADFRVVENGVAVAGIEIKTADPACQEAAQTIAKYVRLSSGALLGNTAKGPRIILQIEQGKLDIEGFRFRFPSPEVMEITGGGPYGIRFGALDFCERYLGVRFLFPGELGEYIPKHKSISIEEKEFQDAPKFLTRYLSSGNDHPSRRLYQEWTPFLRGIRPYRLTINHNLSRMFNSGKFAKTHPEYYPIINGKRYIPAPNVHVHWQPCLSNPGVVNESIKMICDAFAKNPELRTWSLAVTDGNGVCECKDCQEFWPKPDRKNFSGQPDRSRYFMEFYNKVATKVAEKYPDAVLGFYAYGYISNAPENFEAHPSLVPIITYDRLSWIDPERKNNDLERHTQWAKVCRSIGWYDYFFSGRYLLPRTYNHLKADILRTAYAKGVRYFTAEYNPLGVMSGMGLEKEWVDGPMAYMTYKLLWNPEQDENAILDDWYCAAVGVKAAPYLKNYFELLEKFWTKDVQKTAWFARCSRTYLVWTWHDYLDGFDPKILDSCEENLNKVCELSEHRERAEYFRKVFLGRKKKIIYWFRNQEVSDYSDSVFTREFAKDDFNQDTTDWTTWKSTSNSGECSLDAKGGRDGSGALRLNFDDGKGFGFEKSFTVTQSQNFEVSAWFLNEGTDSSTIPYLAIKWYSADGEEEYNFYYSDTHGNSNRQWTKVVCKVASPPDLPCKMKICLLGSLSSKGQVFFDDLVIKTDK